MKMISLTKLKGSGLWEFLEPVLAAGVPPKRSVMVSRMVADRNLMLFVLETLKEAVAARTAYRTLFSFYTTSLLEAINTHGLSEYMLRDLWPFIVSGLSSSDENYQTCTIMVLSTACWKAAVAPALIRSAIDTLIAHTPPHLHSNSIRALIMVVQNTVLSVPVPSTSSATASSSSSSSSAASFMSHSDTVVSGLISEDTLSVLASWTDAAQILSGFLQTQKYDTTTLLSFLLTKLAQDLAKDSSRASFLVQLFNAIDIPDLVPGLTITLLHTYSAPRTSSVPSIKPIKASKKVVDSDNEDSFSDNENSDEEDELDEVSHAKRLSELMAAIDLKYPSQLDQGIATMLEQHPSESKWHSLFENGRHHSVEAPSSSGRNVPTTLTLCLRDTHPTTQIFALSKLLELSSDNRTKELLKKTLLEHMRSNLPQLILNALNVPNLGEHVGAEELFSTLESLTFLSGEVAAKAFSLLMSLFLNPISSSTTAASPSLSKSNSSTPGKKKAKARESLEGASSSERHSKALQLSNASAKLMPVILSALFSNDSNMRALAGPAALQFHQHFVGHEPVLTCQNVFSHYSSSLASGSLSMSHSILALAESAIVNDDYESPQSSWRAIANNPRSRVLFLLVLSCALSQVATRRIKPHPSRTVEQECLNIAKVLLPHFMDDTQTMLLAVDMTSESHLYAFSPDSASSSSSNKNADHIDGIPDWSGSQLQSLLASTPFYKREYFFRYTIWAIYSLIQSLGQLPSAPGSCSDHMLSVALSAFKLLASCQTPSLFTSHFKALFSVLGSDVHVAKFLEYAWTTPQATSSATATTAMNVNPADFPVGLHGSSTSSLVCMRALAFLSSLLHTRLQSPQLETLKETYNEFASDIAVSLLVPLAHHDSSVRIAALGCMSVVGQLLSATSPSSSNPPLTPSKFKPQQSSAAPNGTSAALGRFITELVQKRSEFALSESCLTFCVELFFHQEPGMSEDTHTNVTRAERNALQHYLVGRAVSLPTTFARYSLLHTLLPSPNGPKLAITSPLLAKVLKHLMPLASTEELHDLEAVDGPTSRAQSQAFEPDVFTYRLLEVLLRQWQPDAVEELNHSEAHFSVLVNVLHNSLEVTLPLDPTVVAYIIASNEKLAAISATQTKTIHEKYHLCLQQIALSLITPDFFSKLSAKNQSQLFEHLCELVLSPKHVVKDAVQTVLRSISISANIIVHELQTCVAKTATVPVIETPPPAKRTKSSSGLLPSSLPAPAEPVEKAWIARVTVLLEMLQYKYDALLMGAQYVPSLFALMRNTVEAGNALASDPSAEYIEQLIFTTLITITRAIANARAHVATTTPRKERASSIDQQQQHQQQMQVDTQPEQDANPPAEEDPVDSLRISLERSDFAALETKYDVDCIIQIIRHRSNPSLQNNALLLLSHIARVFPGKVMSNVMSIFSFMGASTERSDDNYTFNVIEKTVERVIPALLSHAPGVEGRVSASALLAVFVDRIDSIPQHRRLMLFTHILTKVLRRGYLPLVLALLMHKQAHAHQLSSSSFQEKIGMPQQQVQTSIATADALSMSSFALTLFHQLSPYECVSAIVYTIYWLNGFEAKLDRSPLVTGRTKDFTATDKSNIHPELIQFAITYMTSRPFVNQLLELSSHDQQRMQNVYLALFQALLMFAKFASATGPSSHASPSPISHTTSSTVTLDGIYKLTDRVNELMSIYTFFDAMSSLFKQNDATIKHRALVLFNERIKAVAKAERAGFDFGEQTTANFIQFSLNMFSAVHFSSSSSSENHSLSSSATAFSGDAMNDGDSLTLALNKQTAALSVEIVARLFGAQEQYQSVFVQLTELVIKALLPFTETLTSTTTRESEAHSESQIRIQASLIVALATLVQHVRDRLLPLINKLFPVIISTLRIAITRDASKDARQLLRQSCLAALHVTIGVMHRFLSQYWPEVLKLLLQPTEVFFSTAQWDSVASTLRLIGSTVPARLLIDPLIATFDYIIKHRNEDVSSELADQRRGACVKLLAETAGVVAEQLDRATLLSHHKQLFKVFLTLFDYGELTTAEAANAPSYSSLVSVDETIIESFMKLTLKLNENLFKPLFLVMLDWAKVSTTAQVTQQMLPPIYTPRTHFFYRLVCTLAEELKGIFVPYFAYLIDHAFKVVLQPAHGIKKNDPILKSNNAFPLSPSNALGGFLVHHQVSLVLNGLQKLFLYDKDGFVDKTRFDRMMPTLVDQLDSTQIEQYKSRVTQSIVPCLAQLAVCIGNDALWKPLNYNVLTKARHQDAQVRFSVLLTVGEFYHRMGEAFLPLLQESTQTLAELLEDSNPEVERQCLLVIKQIEGVLGEEGGVMSLLSK